MGRPLNVGNPESTPLGRPQHKPERAPPEIPFTVFKEAQRDPIVKQFLADARANGEKLESEGKIHF